MNNQLSLIFGALADETRRGMLEQLAKGASNITSLGARYAMSQPAVSKHLRVLERAGLIQRTKQGREYVIRVETSAVDAAQEWIGRYAFAWRQQFDAVDAYLKNMEES